MTRATGRAVQEFNALVYAEYGTNCYVCGTNQDIQVDHLIPVSKGGPEFDLDNARPMCGLHNRQKGAKIGHVRMTWINNKYLDEGVLKP